MECPLTSGQAAELIVGYRAETLDPYATAVFERHLKGCAVCRQASAAQQAVWLTLDIWQPPPVSSNFDRKLFERIASQERLRWWRGLRPPSLSWRPAISVAAACAALLAAFLLKSPANHPASLAPPQSEFQIEQVESALDDMDMLRQIGVEATPAAPGSRQPI